MPNFKLKKKHRQSTLNILNEEVAEEAKKESLIVINSLM